MTAEPSSDTGRIVVGYDGAESSLHALSWAARQAVLTGGPLEVVMTWEWPASYGWAVPIPDDFDPEADTRKVLDTAIAGALSEQPGLKAEARLVSGHPAPVLVEASKGSGLLVVVRAGPRELL